MLRYVVKLERDTNGTILVSFPDVPEAHTFGGNREEALARAVDALKTALMGYMEDRLAIPKPSPLTCPSPGSIRASEGPRIAAPRPSNGLPCLVQTCSPAFRATA